MTERKLKPLVWVAGGYGHTASTCFGDYRATKHSDGYSASLADHERVYSACGFAPDLEGALSLCGADYAQRVAELYAELYEEE